MDEYRTGIAHQACGVDAACGSDRFSWRAGLPDRKRARSSSLAYPTGSEMSANALDKATFSQYLAREEALFSHLKTGVTDKLKPDEQTPINRFYHNSRVWPPQFSPNGNRSYVLMPQGKPRGVAVLLHGLTDSPYSMKYVAKDYQQRGFIAVVPRLLGTAPRPAR